MDVNPDAAAGIEGDPCTGILRVLLKHSSALSIIQVTTTLVSFTSVGIPIFWRGELVSKELESVTEDGNTCCSCEVRLR